MDIKSMTLEELKTMVAEEGEKPFRAAQLYDWMHRKLAEDYGQMTNLSAAFREKLVEKYPLTSLKLVDMQQSGIDGTRKFLFALPDGNLVESVWMKYKHGNSVCISSQVGCKMGCRFCASTLDGWERNLLPSEMLDQIYAITRATGERVSNVVVMGTGEPLDNYENVLRFLELVSDHEGMNIRMRHISMSTCGMVDRIYDLAEKMLQLTLSVSLHAPIDEIRSRTMPINKKWGVEELLRACRDYEKATGRRISFEYAMISGVNDSDECARELAARLKGSLCHVDLIPVNAVSGAGYHKSTIDRQKRFIKILGDRGITATVRRTLGSDINASCGQLRRRYQEEKSSEGI